MRIRTLIITIATLAFTATAAQAATIYTPPLSSEADGTHVCNVVNVSKKSRFVTIELLLSSGIVITTLGPVMLVAGGASALGSSDPVRRYCRVTVKGGKKTIRVSYESRINSDTVAAVNGF